MAQFAEPPAAKELFDVRAGNKKAAGGPANAKFFAQIVQRWFREVEEMTKFPGAQAVELATHMGTAGNHRLDDGIELKLANRGGGVDFARPETERAFGAGATRDVPDPEETAAFNHLIDVINRDTGNARNRFNAAKRAFNWTGQIQMTHARISALDGRFRRTAPASDDGLDILSWEDLHL